jgi:hypothetical protein
MCWSIRFDNTNGLSRTVNGEGWKYIRMLFIETCNWEWKVTPGPKGSGGLCGKLSYDGKWNKCGKSEYHSQTQSSATMHKFSKSNKPSERVRERNSSKYWLTTAWYLEICGDGPWDLGDVKWAQVLFRKLDQSWPKSFHIQSVRAR